MTLGGLSVMKKAILDLSVYIPNVWIFDAPLKIVAIMSHSKIRSEY